MATERNNYEMPTNEEFEDLLQDNLQTLKPLELKEKEVGGEKKLFPFWNSVEPEEVHYSPESYLNAKQKKERSMDSGDNLVNRMEDIMGKMKNTQMVDMTDAVKPKANELTSTTTTQQVTEWDATAEMQTDVETNAAKPKGDNVGAVKPKEADMGNTSTTQQVTEWDATAEMQTDVKSNAAAPKGDNVGAVKPQEADMSNTSTTEKVTEWDATAENAINVDSNAAKPKGDNVGAVKPKEADMSSTATKKQVTEWDSTQDEPKSKLAEPYGGIDFSKFM
jgi:hypothetical protein